MNEQLQLLIELQECDSQMAKILGRKKLLPQKMAGLDESFRVFREEIEENKRKFDDVKARHMEYENKIKRINEGMIRTKERMLEVKNNKEYQAMLKENEAAEMLRSDVETEVICMLDELERLSVLVKADQVTMAEQRKKYGEEKSLLETHLNSIDNDREELEKKRVGLKQKILPDLLVRYEKIKKNNNGIGVISAWKSVCNGCHMNIPPQLYNELQRTTDLIACPNCHRIIYFQNLEKTAESL